MGELLGIMGAIGSGKTTFARYLTDTTPNHAYYETWRVVAEIATAFNQALKAELAYETTNNSLELVNQVLIWLPEAISEHLHHDVVWNQLAIAKHDTLLRPSLYEKLFVYLKIVEKKPKLLDTSITPEVKETFRPLLQWLGGYLVVKISKTIWYDELLRRIELRDPTTSLVVVSGVRYTSDAEALRNRSGHIVAIERPGLAKTKPDVTEAERATIKPEVTIANDGTLEQLRTLAETFANDLMAGDLKKSYAAATKTITP